MAMFMLDTNDKMQLNRIEGMLEEILENTAKRGSSLPDFICSVCGVETPGDLECCEGGKSPKVEDV